MSEFETFENEFEESNLVKSRSFTVVYNDLIRDESISPNCRWLLIYLLSNKPGWVIKTSQIYNHVKKFMGRNALYNVINETIESGYLLRQTKVINNLKRYRYQVADAPVFKKFLRCPENGDTENGDTENGDTKEVLSKEILSKETTTNKEQLVVVQNYECLAKANLSKEDCKALMFYPENRVKLALSFIDNKKFEVKTTRIASLIWHCQQEIPPVHAETKEDFIAKKESEADEIFERVAINKEKFKRLKIKHWNELAVKPRDNHELVEFDVNKIYFKDKDFDRLILKAFKDNKKEEITECEDYDF